MNTLKIVRITSEKRFNDSVKVALFDENENIQRNGLYFEMIEVLIKRIRELNEELESYE